MTIIENAARMGAKHFVHYSFPRHMSMVLLSRRRAIMMAECAEARDRVPLRLRAGSHRRAGSARDAAVHPRGRAARAQKLGPQTAFFSTNDGMQEPLIKAILIAKQGYFVEQSTPAPTAGYPRRSV